ncbi:MAG: hypothetical protein M1830_006694 [Pleopsidium flavum]|nr:MAG: hypothetical protein M1830_006694 [Pleopsidium flavum]
MPSYLRNQTSFSPQSIYPTIQPTSPLPPQKKQKMSITQAYYLAQTARGKLSNEASRADHDLRMLVGHANLLDSLMLELADAEREQESWFNQTVNGAAKASAEPKHISWADTIAEETAQDMESESSDSDSEYDEDEEMDIAAPFPVPARRAPPPPASVTTMEVDSDDDSDYSDDGIEDYSELTLTRTSSAHPPELSHESDSDSEDDSMPPSPPQPEASPDAFSEKQRQAIATTSFYEKQASSRTAPLSSSEQASFFEEGFYLPRRQTQQQQASMVSAY